MLSVSVHLPKVWVTPELDSLTNTSAHTHTHTHTHTQRGKHALLQHTLSPSPVNVWNKWLLQRRQCDHTTVSHLIGRLHENLFVLDRVSQQSAPSAWGNSAWPWMTAAPCRTKQRRKSCTTREEEEEEEEDQRYRLNDNNRTTPQDQLNAPNSKSYLGQNCTSTDSSHLLFFFFFFFARAPISLLSCVVM